ncbi:hypothetical protein [Enterococcus sp. AZ177]|uniref:hypothetical protein n=1 Tax=unclassified Enterococcus TaxID=2608891 RepID=UPI003D2FE893
MRLKKFLISLSVFTLLSSCFAPSLAFANNAEPTESAAELLPTPKESDYFRGHQSRSVATVIIKGAIKFIVKNKTLATNVVRSVAGKTVANNFAKHYAKICASLNPLLKWADIPYQAVYDAVYRALVNSGVAKGTASQIALAIKEGISWFF